MKRKLVHEAIAITLLIVVAMFLRFHYQTKAQVARPLIADQVKYFAAAYNLKKHSAYSLELPNSIPPATRTDLAPGYPIFLTLLIGDDSRQIDFVQRVGITQAIFGIATVLLTYSLARLALPITGALAAGLFTACSPHLVALDDLVLTESLFTFVLMLGLLIFAFGWRYESLELLFIAGLVLGVSSQIRTVAFFLPVALAPLLSMKCQRAQWASPSFIARAIVFFILGWACVLLAYRVFVASYVTNSEYVQEEPAEYAKISSPLTYAAETVRPPNFFVRGDSHVFAENGQQDWKFRTEASFNEETLAYLKWNLWGRIIVLWNFDNAYHGGAYFYAMKRRGFEQSFSLKFVHALMHFLHWPLFLLTVAGALTLLAKFTRGKLAEDSRILLVAALAFCYFLAVLSLVSWLPRYTIPVRPVSYVLALVTVIATGSTLMRRWSENDDQSRTV